MWEERRIRGEERVKVQITSMKVYGSEKGAPDHTGDVSVWDILALKHTIKSLPSHPV